MLENKSQQKLLNLAKIQETLDQVVFENIDTSNNWDKANKELSSLTAEFHLFFKQYIENNGDQMPKSNPYWNLFMDLASKLEYFSAFVEQKLNDDAKGIEKKFEAAVAFLPNRHHETNSEFFEEICATYEAVTNQKLEVPDYSVQQTIENYYRYVTTLN